jgi:hypothetical protein
MEKIQLDYYYGNESEQFSFFRIPKALFLDDRFKNLSVESKILYGMLLDRMGLSRKNGWLDKNNRVYIIYTIDEIMKHLNCGKQKAVKLMAELDSYKGIGLIEKVRLGLGKPNLIYVKNFISVIDMKKSKKPLDDKRYENQTSGLSESNLQKYENQTSEVLKSNPVKCEKQNSVGIKIKPTEVLKSKCNNTEFNDIDSNHIYHIDHKLINKNKTDGLDKIRNRQYYFELIKKNIEYESIIGKNNNAEDIDNMLNIMADIISLPDEATIRVNGIALPIIVVRERFMEINSMHIEYIIKALDENSSNVRNIRNYLITTIFNAPSTMSQYYRSVVNYAMNGR